MPKPLYTVKSVLSSTRVSELAQQLKNKAILFTEDGCYNLLKSEIQQFEQCHVLADDASARGLSCTQPSQIWLSKQEWVELTIKHQPIIQIGN
ncbi:DsrH/TusB family sulfur metabolism protein [Catenovulum sp. SX2]|uniref:DsrH/TusB family sulfur metabolism protein n=1 Tax=Catenovulum sp. SX2 TaxID=3398614 RepID=UPI003F866447